MSIKQKTVYETSDGKSFSSEELAVSHEVRLNVYDIAYNEKACYGAFEFSDEEEFCDFVLKYADMIRADDSLAKAAGEGND